MPTALASSPFQPTGAPFLRGAPHAGTAPPQERAAIAEALQRPQAAISPKYFYDQHGSELFEAITRLPEYYPTRTERELMSRHGPAIAQAVGAQTEVLVDGGVRSGVDVFKALALGARGVLIGRPWVWALAAQGEAGVRTLLAQWQRELLLAMTLAGVTRVADIGPQHLDTD